MTIATKRRGPPSPLGGANRQRARPRAPTSQPSSMDATCGEEASSGGNSTTMKGVGSIAYMVDRAARIPWTVRVRDANDACVLPAVLPKCAIRVTQALDACFNETARFARARALGVCSTVRADTLAVVADVGRRAVAVRRARALPFVRNPVAPGLRLTHAITVTDALHADFERGLAAWHFGGAIRVRSAGG